VDVAVHANLSRDRAEAALSLACELTADRPVRGSVQARITQGGLPVAEVEDRLMVLPTGTCLVQSCEVARARLWWPHGLGGQPLYEAHLALLDEAGEALDRRAVAFGLREVDLLAAGEGEPGGLRLNGWATRLLGMDAPRAPARGWEAFLTAARAAHVTLLRVPRDAVDADLCALCDGIGILIWQEFSPAPGEPLEAFRGAAEAAVIALRNHPCLLAWGPGPAAPEAYAAALREAVADDDPQRLWLPRDAPGVAEVPPGPAAALRAAVEGARRQAECWLVVAPGAPDPVAALGSAGAPFHVSAALPTLAWAGHSEFRAQVWLHNDGPERSLLNVVAAVSDATGRDLYQENLAAEAPENAAEDAGDLYWRFPPDFSGPFALTLEVIDEEGETLARNRYEMAR